MRSTHASKLERWLGPTVVEHLSRSMQNWYGPPIAVAGVPGNVWAHPGGDFRGIIDSGQFGNAVEFGLQRLKRIGGNVLHRQLSTVGMGFSSLSDLIYESTQNGKQQVFPFQKTGPTGVTGVTSTLWRVGAQPAAGSAGSAAPGGRAPTSATTGAFPFTNPSSPDTQHFVNAQIVASVAGNTLLLYDRIFDVAKTINSTTAEAVTGVPTRYQSTTTTAQDYIGGNFLFVEVGGTALAATAHNWTTCTYTNQANTGATLPSLTGNSGAIVDRLDHPTNQWFAPLATGDTGVKALTQMQCSALVATGAVNFVIGHPIAWFPCPIANLACTIDGITTAFSLTRIFDNAALSFLEVNKPSTTATSYTGQFTTVSG